MKSVQPVVIASANENRFRNGGGMTCVEKAFAEMKRGADVLDAPIAGVSMYPGASYAVCTETGAETLPSEPLLDGKSDG